MQPLRQLGIPAAGLVDIDVLKDGGQTWTRFLASGFVPELEREPLANLRARICDRFTTIGRDMKREGGIALLDGGAREAANNLFDRLQEYGLFVVRRGELEAWLGELEATGHGPAWLVDMFAEMGEDPDSDTYVRPTDGDVWEFVDSLKTWLEDPNRKGIPS